MLNLDTHIVVKVLLGELSKRENDLVVSSDLCISDVVIWEIAKLHQLGRVLLNVQEPLFLRFLERVTVHPIDARIALASTRLDFRSDPADEIISATSIVHACPLLTRDQRILASKVVPLACV